MVEWACLDILAMVRACISLCDPCNIQLLRDGDKGMQGRCECCGAPGLRSETDIAITTVFEALSANLKLFAFTVPSLALLFSKC